jgi:hypothetical protein
MKLEFSRQIFAKYSYIKFYANQSSGWRAAVWGRTKLIVVLRNFANEPKKQGTFLSNAPRFQTEHYFSRTLPVSTRLSFCQTQNVDEDYGALLEWHRQGKPEVLWETPVPIPFLPPHITHGLHWDGIIAFALTGRWSTSLQITSPYQKEKTVCFN